MHVSDLLQWNNPDDDDDRANDHTGMESPWQQVNLIIKCSCLLRSLKMIDRREKWNHIRVLLLIAVTIGSSIRRPAMQALVNVTVEPQIIALKAKDDKSDFRSGTREPIAPSVIPIDEKLEKPHSAYVAIV